MPKTRATKRPTTSRRRQGREVTKVRRGGQAAANAPPADTLVTIRAYDIEPAHLPRTKAFERIANDWSYILRTRARWADKIEYRRMLGERALKDLKKLGIGAELVKVLATKPHIEVEFHRASGSKDKPDALFEAACDVPWEYLLSAATRESGRYGSILVTRLLRNESSNGIATDARRVLFVESGPGRLKDLYDFESERRRIKAALGAVEAPKNADEAGEAAPANGRTITFSATDEVGDLAALVRPKENAFDVIHVTGIDTHQAMQNVDTLYADLEERHPGVYDDIVDDDGRVADGIVLRAANVRELPVDYRQFADLLINPKDPPSLVTLNLYYSGARTARELVASGARVALGFLDEIDDDVAELFFQTFYWKWAGPDGVFIPEALLEAWGETSDHAPGLHGTALVMWLGRSVFDVASVEAATTVLPARTTEQRSASDRLAQIPISQLLQVDLVLHDNGEINYSLLHNDRPLLKKLTLTKLVDEPLEDIAVFVELNVGGQNYPYRCTQLVLNEVQLALAHDIRIPLTASLPRSLRERVHSTVYVKVTVGGRTAYETTERVTLIPVDEWLDDTRNNPWLPSFVLPRDPAVFKIVSSARRYLIGICDDPAAGFDGYQSEDETADDPTAGIDRQVQAIWTALVNDYRFQYINPPPAYSERTQRLRTPSDMLESNSGTCIDLALLLASCLEYVDIYPVIVLLEGHAFVGYWRSEQYHEAFAQVSRTPARALRPGDELIDPNAIPSVDRYGWRSAGLHYDEVLAHVVAGDLVLLEATMLTGAYGFAEAVDEGRANLKSREEFESLIDIRLARMASPPVTPLPITRASS